MGFVQCPLNIERKKWVLDRPLQAYKGKKSVDDFKNQTD